MEESKHKVDAKILVVVLSLLALAVVVLVVVNVVLAVRGNAEGDYDSVAVKCLKMENDEEAIDCLNDIAFSYNENDNCEGALKVYDSVPAERFDKYSLKKLYDEAYSLSLSCDESLQSYWENKFYDLANQLEGRD